MPTIATLMALVSTTAVARARLVLTVNSEADAVDAVPGDRRCGAIAGACTLRAAVQEANATAGVDVIVLPAGIYELGLPGAGEDAAATGDLDLADDVTVTGAGAARSRIDGGGVDGVLHVLPGVSADIQALTISGGVHQGESPGAGGIFNQGILHLVDSAVQANAAGIPYGTGGLRNAFVATVERTSFALNAPTAITNNGMLSLLHTVIRDNGPVTAITSDEGSLVMVASEIAGQGGTALFCQAGPIYLEGTWIHDTSPGAAMLVASGSVTVLDSVIEHNAGGGINNDGVLRVEGSTLRANSPRLLLAEGGPAGVAGGTPYTGITNTGSAEIVASAILDHRGGGVVNEQGGVTLINVTVSGNTATLGSGGISNNGTLAIRSSTITDNSSTDPSASGGVSTIGDAINSAVVSNSIIAANRADAPGGAPDCRGPIASQGHVLIGNRSGCDELATTTGDLLDVDPGLAPLADNGGRTLTHALKSGSAAIDAGNPTAPESDPTACPATDQRGAGRPHGAACDIGAFELDLDCGNGIVDRGEDCDAGRPTGSECCSSLCRFAPPVSDCNGDGQVSIDELLSAVHIALAPHARVDCPAADADGDGTVGIGDLLRGVLAALRGCEAENAG